MNLFKNILLTVDNRHPDEALLTKAIRVAKKLDAKLTLAEVLPSFSWLTRMTLPDAKHVRELLQQEKKDYLGQLQATAKSEGLDVDSVFLEGKSSVEISKYVAENNIDLVMRFAKGSASKEPGLLGRTSKQLLRYSICPVWLCRTMDGREPKNITVCLDPEKNHSEEVEFADSLLQITSGLAERFGGEYSILHAWEAWNAEMVKSRVLPEDFKAWKSNLRRQAETTFDAFLARKSMSVSDSNVHVIEGDPTRSIPRFIEKQNPDLVVMGTVGRSGMAGMLIGNTAERIIDKIPTDMLTLHPKS